MSATGVAVAAQHRIWRCGRLDETGGTGGHGRQCTAALTPNIAVMPTAKTSVPTVATVPFASATIASPPAATPSPPIGGGARQRGRGRVKEPHERR
jgi:hypothetical protein